MELRELIAEVLSRGTDTTFSELTSSERFERLLVNKELLFTELLMPDADDELAKALLASYANIDSLLADTYCAQTADVVSQPQDAYMQVLLETTGEELVATAIGCLPQRLLDLAEVIRSTEEDEKQGLVHFALTLFQQVTRAAHRVRRGQVNTPPGTWELNVNGYDEPVVVAHKDFLAVADHYRESGDPKTAELLMFASSWGSQVCGDFGGASPDWMTDAAIKLTEYYEAQCKADTDGEFAWIPFVTEIEYPSEMALPKEYGVLGESPVVPSCLGMCIMLVAFARLCGMPVMLVNPVESNDDALIATNAAFQEALLRYLDDMGYSEDFDDRYSYQELLDHAKSYEQRIFDFHYSVAMQLDSGKWMHFDPYLNRVGVFGEQWQLSDTYDRLRCYKSVLPGLTLVRDDNGVLDRWNADRLQLLLDAIEQIGQLYQWHCEVPLPLANIVERADDGFTKVPADFAMPDLIYVTEQTALSHASDNLYESFMALLGLEPKDRAKGDEFTKFGFYLERLTHGGNSRERQDDEEYTEWIEDYMVLFYLDAEWREERERELYMLLLEQCLREAEDLLNEKERQLLDPVMQFSLPEYNLALAVANHVRCWTDCDVSGRVFLDLSSSQIYWHEAVDLSQGYEESEAEHLRVLQAEATVRSKSHRHPAVQKKLDYLTRARQRG